MKIFGIEFLTREAKAKPTPTDNGGGSPVVGGFDWSERLLGSSSPDVAAKVSTVYQCVDLISSALAVMPLRYKVLDQKTGVMKEWVKYDPDRLNYLLNVRPNSRMNGYDLKKQAFVWKLTLGNAFILPVDARNMHLNDYSEVIDHLVLIHPSAVNYDVARDIYQLGDEEQGVPQQSVPGRMIWHLKNTSFGSSSSYWGQSVLHYALNSIRMASTGNNEVLKRVASGGRGKYILNYDGTGSPYGTHRSEQMKGAAMNLSNEINSGDIVALPYKGLTLTPVSMNSADLKLLETTDLARKDIAGFFNLPLYMLGQATSNYKTPDAANAAFVNLCLTPHCVQTENEIWSKYTTDKDWWKVSFDFDEDARMKLDVDMQIKKDRAELDSGISTVNELRAKNGKGPVKGGDNILLSANLKTLEMFEKEGAGKKKKKTAAPETDEDEQPDAAGDENA